MDLKSKAMTGAFWKMAERILAQSISFVVTILLARLLLPEDYGIVGMVTIFFNFANVLISGGLNTALIQKKDSDSDDYSTVFTVSFLVGIFLYLILFFSAPLISRLYGQPILVPIIRTMGLSLPVYAIKSIVCAYTSATLQFRKFFFATLGGTLASGIVGVGMALNGFGPWALVAQQVTNTVIDTVILYCVTKLKVRFYISVPRLKKLFSYGWKILVTSLLGNIYTQTTPLVMGIKFSLADLSFYTKGKTFSDVLTVSITGTLSSVLFPILAKVQDSKEQLLHGTRVFIRTVSFLIFPVMFGFFAISDNFIRVLLTDKWLSASYYVKIFCISNLFDIVAVGNCETIKAMGRSDIYLKIEVIKKSLYFVTLILFIAFTNSPRILALSNLVIALISVVINVIPNIRLLGYSVKMQVQDLAVNFIAGFLMCIVVLLAGQSAMPAPLMLIFQIAVGAAFYLLFNLLIKNRNFYDCLDIVRRIFRKT